MESSLFSLDITFNSVLNICFDKLLKRNKMISLDGKEKEGSRMKTL